MQFSTSRVDGFIENEQENLSWCAKDGAKTKLRLKRIPVHYERTKRVFVRGIDFICGNSDVLKKCK